MASRSGHRPSGGGRPAIPNEIIINASGARLGSRSWRAELHRAPHRARTRSQCGGHGGEGPVTRVLPGMQAAFVDIGLEKAAFLYVGDYLDDARSARRTTTTRNAAGAASRRGATAGTAAADRDPAARGPGDRRPGRQGADRHQGRAHHQPPLDRRAPPRAHAVVEAGRRVAPDRLGPRAPAAARHRDAAAPARTSASSSAPRARATREADLEADVAYLSAVWEEIRAAQVAARAPATLYEELSLPLRAIRDFANGSTRRIVVDDPAIHEKMQRFLDALRRRSQAASSISTRATSRIFDHDGLEARDRREPGQARSGSSRAAT